jgi:hypothetical protein
MKQSRQISALQESAKNGSREEADPIYRPIYVLGCPRSGNTLVSAILNKHPSLFILLEANTFSSQYLKWTEGIRNDRAPRQAFINLVTKDYAAYHDRFSISSREVEQTIQQSPPTWSDMLASYMHLLMREGRSTAQRWGDKTPHNVAHLEHIFRSYPEAQFVFVQRDPRHVTTSLSKKSFPFTSARPLRNAEVVSQYLRVFKRQKQRIPRSSLLTVQYERLIEDPERTTRSVCEFLGIDFRPTMLAEADQRTRAIFGWQNHKVWEGIEPQPSSRLPENGASIEAYLSRHIEELGYSLVHTQWSTHPLYKAWVMLRVLPFRMTRWVLSFFYRRRYEQTESYMMLDFPEARDIFRWVRSSLYQRFPSL